MGVESVEERIQDYTAGPANWNSWPDLAEIADAVEPPMTLHGLHLQGQFEGGGGVLRQVPRKNIPYEIRRRLPDTPDDDRRLENVTFMLRPNEGNAGGSGKRNLLAVFPAKFVWTKDGYECEWPGLRVELGCAHQMEHRKLGNCWHESRCTRCDYSYEVDSSG